MQRFASTEHAPYHVDPLDHRPPQPGISSLLICALALWAASAIVFFTTESMQMDMCMLVCICGFVLASLFLVVAVCMRRFSLALLIGAFVCLGCSLGSVATLHVLEERELASSGTRIVCAHVLQDSSLSDHGFVTVCAAFTEEGRTCKVRVFTDEGFLVGDRFALDARLSPLKESTAEFYRTQGICGQVSAKDVKRISATGVMSMLRDVRAQTIDCLEDNAGEHAPLMEAIICGHRQQIAHSPLYEQFKACGLAHIIAVSGAHTAIVLALLMWLLILFKVPKPVSIGVSITFVGMYLVFAGTPVSAIRSAVMAVLALLSFFAHRRSASQSSLGLCVIAFIVTDPCSSLSVSLFLSVASTLGITLFAPLMISWFPYAPSPVRTAFIDPTSLTLSSNLATLPFSAALFSQLSLIAPVSNIVVSPLFAIACSMGLIACVMSLLFPFLASWLIACASVPFLLFEKIVSVLSSIPYAAVACSLPVIPMLLFSVVICIILWASWPCARKLKKVIPCAFICVLGIFACSVLPKPDAVSVLDVGQGDAILVTSGTSHVLVDTGNVDSKLREELGSKGIFHLDAVIITHPDDDHCASLASLGSYVQVDRILFAQDVYGCGCRQCERLLSLANECAPAFGTHGIGMGDRIQVGRASLEVLWPHGFTDEGGNADSLCMMVRLDADEDNVSDWSVLLTGDAETDQLECMRREGLLEDVDVLKVGHHGSRVSLDEEQARLLDPEVSLISVGAQNRYGHPTKEVLDVLGAIDSRVFRTDEDGTVTVSFRKDDYAVATSSGTLP